MVRRVSAVGPRRARAETVNPVARRRHSRLGTTITVPLTTGGLSACSPAPENIIAVEAVNSSTARLLTMTCSEFTADQFGVQQGDGPDNGLRDWAVPRALTGPRVDSVQVSKLRDLPAGEVPTSDGDGGTVTSGRDDHYHELAS